MTEDFDVDAVLRKWGFALTHGPLGTVWCGRLDGALQAVASARAYVFANELLRRN